MLVPSHCTAREIFSEEAFDAVGVARRRIEERHPARVGPGPHRAVADALGRIAIEHGDAGGIGAEQAGSSRLVFDESSDWGEQIDRGRDASAECLRSHVDTDASKAGALPLDGLMLDEFVAHRLDDERIGELASLDDLRRRSRRHDRVVVGASDGLVEALLDDDARGDHIENQATRVAHRRHHGAATRANAKLRGHAIEHGHARQVRGRRPTPRMTSAALPFLVVRGRVVLAFRGGGHDEALDG
jgi:hypothetical protein